MENGGPQLDFLSPVARDVLKTNASGAYVRLTATGQGTAEVSGKLSKLNPSDVLSCRPGNVGEATAMLSGLWLWHDWLEQSHKLSQSLQTESGSFWHAIMHRREGDFSNSRYWYAKCSSHPIFPALSAAAGDLINPYPADKSLLRIAHGGWNANAFVDLVAAVHESPDDPRHKLAVAIQQLEWRTLFDHCTRAALGT